MESERKRNKEGLKAGIGCIAGVGRRIRVE